MVTRRPKVILCFPLHFSSWFGWASTPKSMPGRGEEGLPGAAGDSVPAAPHRGARVPQPLPRGSISNPVRRLNPPPQAWGGVFSTGLAGGMVGGLLGGMLFRSLGFAGGGSGMGEGFGFGDIFLILIILGIIYFVVKRFRARQTAMQMSTAGAGGYSFPGPSPGPVFTPPPPEENTGAPVSDGLRHIKAMDPSFEEKNFKDLAGDVFFKIQGGWTRRDLNTVRSLLTPEMFGILKKIWTSSSPASRSTGWKTSPFGRWRSSTLDRNAGRISSP